MSTEEILATPCGTPLSRRQGRKNISGRMEVSFQHKVLLYEEVSKNDAIPYAQGKFFNRIAFILKTAGMAGSPISSINIPSIGAANSSLPYGKWKEYLMIFQPVHF